MSADAHSAVQPNKPRRILACVLCQQRKIKCDRKFPCANCLKSRAQCVPATLNPRKKRRRHPERDLLDRVRHYEELLRKNNIDFEPLNRDLAVEYGKHQDEDSDDDQIDAHATDPSSPSATSNSDRVFETKTIWNALHSSLRDDEDAATTGQDAFTEGMIKSAWDENFKDSEHLLFGSSPGEAPVDLSTLHPEPAHIFKLWQVYLDNVNPLLCVIHVPSLQGRIVEAASHVRHIPPILEAVMFSIYCMSVQSLDGELCRAAFGSSQVDLLTRYRFGCRQALLNCSFLRSRDRECLTALYLYLLSVRACLDPRSLSSMVAIAMRMAQTICLQVDSPSSKCSVFEAEMRRRLWWSMVAFDARASEMSDYSACTLNPTWHCKIPLNINDSDLRVELKEPPRLQSTSIFGVPFISDTIFAIMRSELCDLIRHSDFLLDFVCPPLKIVARETIQRVEHRTTNLASLEQRFEEKYFRYCDLDVPLQFMTVWMARGLIARCHLLTYFASLDTIPAAQADKERDAAIGYAIQMLEIDTRIMNSPIIKGFRWFTELYFPFVAYVFLAHNLQRRQIDGAWDTMADNFDCRFETFSREPGHDKGPLFKTFANFLLYAWHTQSTTQERLGIHLPIPRIVTSFQAKLACLAANMPITPSEQPQNAAVTLNPGIDMSADITGQSMMFQGLPSDFLAMDASMYAGIPPQLMSSLDGAWPQMDWSWLNAPMPAATPLTFQTPEIAGTIDTWPM